jgi:hypothetical protein
MIIFNGAIWHGHTANVTPDVRRSIQGTLFHGGCGLDSTFAIT